MAELISTSDIHKEDTTTTTTTPHSKNDRYWSLVNRHELVGCKKAHGEKAMAWVVLLTVGVFRSYGLIDR